MALFRCVVCKAFTKAEPLLVLRSWRMHSPCCIDCMLSDEVPLDRYLRPAHVAWRESLLAFFITGRWRWSLRGIEVST